MIRMVKCERRKAKKGKERCKCVKFLQPATCIAECGMLKVKRQKKKNQSGTSKKLEARNPQSTSNLDRQMRLNPRGINDAKWVCGKESAERCNPYKKDCCFHFKLKDECSYKFWAPNSYDFFMHFIRLCGYVIVSKQAQNPKRIITSLQLEFSNIFYISLIFSIIMEFHLNFMNIYEPFVSFLILFQ